MTLTGKKQIPSTSVVHTYLALGVIPSRCNCCLYIRPFIGRQFSTCYLTTFFGLTGHLQVYLGKVAAVTAMRWTALASGYTSLSVTVYWTTVMGQQILAQFASQRKFLLAKYFPRREAVRIHVCLVLLEGHVMHSSMIVLRLHVHRWDGVFKSSAWAAEQIP
jgi:hypothetical protein